MIGNLIGDKLDFSRRGAFKFDDLNQRILFILEKKSGFSVRKLRLKLLEQRIQITERWLYARIINLQKQGFIRKFRKNMPVTSEYNDFKELANFLREKQNELSQAQVIKPSCLPNS